MVRVFLVVLAVFTALFPDADRVTRPRGLSSLNNIVLAFRMKCDDATDDTTALINAIAAGGPNTHIILPSGVCLISVESSPVSVYDGSWISGAGMFATTIKRKNGGSANNSMFGVASGGVFGTVGNVTFTDFTIDGNQTNQSSGADNIQALGPTNRFTALRMRLINARRDAIALFASSGFTTDALIASSNFENNGFSGATPCNGSHACGDIVIQAPLRIRVERNRSEGAQTFLETPPITGSGNVAVSENIVNHCLGFGVALGGGGTNPGPARIFDNIFNCPASIENIIDLALWLDVRVANNTITNGTTNGVLFSNGIGDGPPANKVTITGNRIFGNPASSTSCIALGGSDLTITANTCSDAGGPGILIAVNNTTGEQKSLVIRGNIVKNTSRFGSGGAHSGIEFYLQPGGSSALSGVIVKRNKIYDDQGSPTQAYGIVLAPSGAQTTGYSNFTIEGNDVRGNKTGGILNNASGAKGILIRRNRGFKGMRSR
jgi:hypothetical protein